MRLLLLATLLTAPAMAAEPTNAELAARVAGLEARMALLEARPATATAQARLSPKALEKKNWLACKQGMSVENIRALLGDPTDEHTVSAVNQYDVSRSWMYGDPGVRGGSVVFQGERVVQCFTWGLAP